MWVGGNRDREVKKNKRVLVEKLLILSHINITGNKLGKLNRKYKRPSRQKVKFNKYQTKRLLVSIMEYNKSVYIEMCIRDSFNNQKLITRGFTISEKFRQNVLPKIKSTCFIVKEN